MKKTILLLLLLAVACAPVQPEIKNTDTQITEPQVTTQEQVITPPQPAPEKTEMEETETTPTDPYTQLGCEQLLKAEEFAEACGKEADNLLVTYKTGTRNCIINIKDRQNERLTAGLTLTGYADAETATKEFERRLVVLKVGADKSVGERAYVPPIKMVDREALEFLRGRFIIEAGTDTRLCSKEGLLAFSKTVDSRIE